MKLFAQILCVLTLAGCGGGNSDGTPPPPSVLGVSGTAATGMALAGATINAKCKVGTGSATTATDGKYSLTIPAGTLPCFIEANNPVNGSKLHSVAIGAGTSAVANITPITEMLAARALKNEPATFFGAFDEATLTKTFTPATIIAAQTDVANVLASTVDIALNADYLATPLTAATPANPAAGDAHDKLLDKLGASVNASQMNKLVTALAHVSTVADIRALLTELLNNLPTANAGVPQSVFIGTVVKLDASASVLGAGNALSYSWTLATRPAGSTSVLSSPTSVSPVFTPDVAGLYIAKLVVFDGNMSSVPVTVGIAVSDGNAAPVARAVAPVVVEVGKIFVISGSSSSADTGRTIISFAWTFTTKPPGSTLSISDTDGRPIVIADVPGTYVVSLTVYDGRLHSAATSVSFEAVAPDVTPASLTQISGNGQTVLPNQLSAPLAVRVLNSAGVAISGIPVVFSAEAGRPSLNDSTVISDAAGLAAWRGYLSTAGQQHIQATVAGLPAVDFTVDVTGAGSPFNGVYQITWVPIAGTGNVGRSFDVALEGATINVNPERFPPQPNAFSESTGSIRFVVRDGIDILNWVTGTLVMDSSGRVTGGGTVEETWMGNSHGIHYTWTAQRR